MSPLLSLQELRLNRNLQTLLLFVRLLLTCVIGWHLYSNPSYSKVFVELTTYSGLLAYLTCSILYYVLILFKPTSNPVFFLGPIIDAIFGISLLFLLPDQANISVIIAITFIVACLNDLKFFQLISLNILYIASALIAGWYFDTLYHATLYSAHIVSATMILVGYVYYFKNHQLNNHSDLKDSLNTAVLQKKHLIDALFYLLPFHQRNQTPLTLLLIRIETSQIKDKSYMKEIISLYKSRLRKCDFLVQIDPQHLAILLSDTNNEQATTVVKALKQLVDKSELKNSMLNYAIAKFPLEKEIALDHILQQSMHALHEAELQKIERIIFISAKQQD